MTMGTEMGWAASMIVPALFAQQNPPRIPPNLNPLELMGPIAIMAGALLFGGLALAWAIRWYRRSQEYQSNADDLLMTALREAAEEEELTPEEYERARDVLRRRARGESTTPPPSQSAHRPAEPTADHPAADPAPVDPDP